MAPWDEMQQFDLPITSLVTVVPGSQQLVEQDPNRVILIMQGLDLNFVGFIPAPANPSLPGATGVFSNQTLQAYVWTQKEHGPLAQVSWTATNNNAVNVLVSVIQVRLRVWNEVPLSVGVAVPQNKLRISEQVMSNARTVLDRLRGRLGAGNMSGR